MQQQSPKGTEADIATYIIDVDDSESKHDPDKLQMERCFRKTEQIILLMFSLLRYVQWDIQFYKLS